MMLRALRHRHVVSVITESNMTTNDLSLLYFHSKACEGTFKFDTRRSGQIVHYSFYQLLCISSISKRVLLDLSAKINSCAFATVEKAENACILNLSLLLRTPIIGVKHEHERLIPCPSKVLALACDTVS